jgi:L-histidine N-alpha-methyltransferase
VASGIETRYGEVVARGVDPVSRFVLERRPSSGRTLAEDVREGLFRPQKAIPSKYFYDEAGSRLFDVICDLPEYYLARAETRLLERHSREILGLARPTDLVELGSGSARKACVLLDAAAAEGLALRYCPFDVCEEALRSSGLRLVERYPWLEVHAIAGDYERSLRELPQGRRRLVAFLGSTIGNYGPAEAAGFVAELARGLRPGEWFLLGADLVKAVEILEAAYDDARGVTAEFNRNVLRVLNRELDADFRIEEFHHVAFFDREHSQIEMHLRASRAQRVELRALATAVELAAGETIRTEISRKFTPGELRALCEGAGLAVRRTWVLEPSVFALVLAERP